MQLLTRPSKESECQREAHKIIVHEGKISYLAAAGQFLTIMQLKSRTKNLGILDTWNTYLFSDYARPTFFVTNFEISLD